MFGAPTIPQKFFRAVFAAPNFSGKLGPVEQNAQTYESWRQTVDSRFQSRVEHHEQQARFHGGLARQARADWDEAVEQLDKLWVKLSGSEDDSTGSTAEPDVAATNGHTTPSTSKKPSPSRSITAAGIVPKRLMENYVQEVLKDPTVTIVTQTEIRKRIEADHYVADSSLNSLRIRITNRLNELVEQGYLELIEKANGGQPNKYRKTGKVAEASLLGP